MTYEQTILNKLKDSNFWPTYRNPDLMAQLDELADDAFTHATERDCIASVLIYQQLIEELFKVLLQSLNFLVQAHLLPFEIHFKEPKKQMFGELIKTVESTIEFPNKTSLIEIANRTNKKRIEIAHGLTKRESLEDLVSLAISVRSDFEEIFPLFADSIDWVRQCLHDISKDRDDDE